MKEVALEMLKHPDKCKLDHVNEHGNTALILACYNNMKEVALEILKHPDKCKLDKVNKYGNTALILACKKEMTEVASALLKYNKMCSITHIDENCNTALFYAQKNNMTNVIDTFYKYVDIYSALQLTKSEKELLDQYFNKKIDDKISQMGSNLEEIQQQYNNLNDMMEKINKLSKNGGCIMCFEETCISTVFVECKHILHVCSECCNVLDKKCPICRIDTPIIIGCFAI
jgi:hypothetical protein